MIATNTSPPPTRAANSAQKPSTPTSPATDSINPPNPLPPTPDPIPNPPLCASVPSCLSASSPSLLELYINLNYDLRALSRSTNTPIPDLLTWLASPQTKQTLADLQTAATDSLTLRATEARRAAIDALEYVLQNSDDLIEKRRAATALLRALNARPQRQSPEDQTSPTPSPTSAQCQVPSASIPSSPHDVLATVLEATSKQAGLDPDAALATLHACCAPGATINDEPIAADPDDFIEDANDLPNLIHPHVQIITHKPEITDTTYTRRLNIIHYGGRTVRATFTLQPISSSCPPNANPRIPIAESIAAPIPSPTIAHCPLPIAPTPSPSPCNSVNSVVQNKPPWRITNLQLDPIPTGFP